MVYLIEHCQGQGNEYLEHVISNLVLHKLSFPGRMHCFEGQVEGDMVIEVDPRLTVLEYHELDSGTADYEVGLVVVVQLEPRLQQDLTSLVMAGKL